MIEDMQDTEVGDVVVEGKKLYTFGEALKCMLVDEVEMRLVTSTMVKHRCLKSPMQLQRTYGSDKWMNIDYYHGSEIDGEWEVVGF